MKNIEKYVKGNLNHLFTLNLEKKEKHNKSIRNKAILYKKIDSIMQGAFLATEAEIEMVGKKIDKVAAVFVSDFYNEKENSNGYNKFFKWS